MQYRIAWKDNRNGHVGISPKLFEAAEARALAAELNEENPDIEHVAVEDSTTIAFKSEVQVAPPSFVPITDSDLMPFGEHKGRPMAQVPSHYLDYIIGLPWVTKEHPEVVDYVAHHRKAIDQDLERSNS